MLLEQLTNNISKMYFTHWKLPGVCERRWSINIQVPKSGEVQTIGGQSSYPSE